MNDQPANSVIEKFVQLSKNEKSVKQKKRYDVVLLYLEGRSKSDYAAIPTLCFPDSLFCKKGAAHEFLVRQPQ